MIDTGANRSFISSALLNHDRRFSQTERTPREVYLADGLSSLSIHGELNLPIVIKDIYTSIQVLVVKDLYGECILGMDFINKYKLIIDTASRSISIEIRNHRFRIPIVRSDKNLEMDGKGANNMVFLSWQKNRMIKSTHELSSDTKNDNVRVGGLMLGNIISDKSTPSFTTNVKRGDLDLKLERLVEHINDTTQQRQIKNVLHNYDRLFDTTRSTIATNVRSHEIITIDHPPPSSKPYDCTPEKRQAMFKIVDELLQSGLIRPSFSAYAAPALLVPKKDNTWRMVVDYKKLNNITIKDSHPLPNMERAIQTLGGGYEFFSKFDLKSGFWQIPIRESDKNKTAFVIAGGLYEWNVLPQGLKNSPPSFQRIMAEILSPCRHCTLVYIDDIVIFSRTFDDHITHLNQVLSILAHHNFKLNPPKCFVLHRQIDYLSHTISQLGVKPNKEKISAIMNLREPSTLSAANKFIGGLSWYRKFLPKFATIAAPIMSITNLTKPNRKKFKWGQTQHESFVKLKQLLIGQPLFLQFPIDGQPVILTTDASKVGIGGTLQQMVDGQLKNLYYHSQITTPTQRRYDPIELEALAIWVCCQRMRPYLLGRSIIIYTDHCPLCNMMNKNVKNKRVNRVSMLLQEYNIEKIIHIKGQNNCLADYLSRYPNQKESEEIFEEDYGLEVLFKEEPLNTVRVPVVDNPRIGAVVTRSMKKIIDQQSRVKENSSLKTDEQENSSAHGSQKEILVEPSIKNSIEEFDWNRIQDEQAKDRLIQDKIRDLKRNPTQGSFVLQDNILYKLMSLKKTTKKKVKLIYLPSSMIKSILDIYHSSPLSGHFGIQRTYYKLKSRFWWPNMKFSIIQYVKGCLPCQQHNINRRKKPGHLCSSPVPQGPFQLIGIDFCGPFKRTPRENQYVLCVTDYYSRWITAIALPDCTAQTTAQSIFNEYICKYGIPTTILSDQGSHFNNRLMEMMTKLIGYNHIYSTVYHPQSNGMVERFNGTFVPQLAKLQDKENNNWDEYLQPIVFAYNTGTHASTGYSPFQLQFGQNPKLPTDSSNDYVFDRPVDYYFQLKKSLKIIRQFSQQQSIKTREISKRYYDKNRMDQKFDVGDRILTKIQGSRSKLDPRYSKHVHVVVRCQHPVYFVQDNVTKNISQVHVNDIRPILIR